MIDKKTYSFEAETERLLELLTHSIYSNKEIFLRELISNSSDAIDKARIKSLTDTSYLWEDTKFKIKLTADKENNVITIEDNGIWMTKDEMISHLGTIAKSGTKDFIEKLKESKEQNNLIGQFGVGFYSVFMVAKKVEVSSKSNDSEKAHTWISEWKWSFEIIDSDKTSRWTSLKIYLKDEEKDFVEYFKISELVKKYSNYVWVPIEMEKEEEKDGKKEMIWEQLNETVAIWNKSKSEITPDEYNKFYSSTTYDFEKPLAYIHSETEWILSYKSILFVPKKKSMFANVEDNTKDYWPKLYVQNVLILDNAKDLLPVWLRFVSGVVATNDLPLNISREMLQSNHNLDKIKKALTKKVIDKLSSVQKNEKEEYKEFLQNYSRLLKEWVYYDSENKEKIASLLSFKSLLKSEDISLDEYLSNQEKKEWKENFIYYVLAKSSAEAMANPYIDTFKNRNIDVIILTDPIDEWLISSFTEYNTIKLKSINSSNLEELDSEKTPEEKKVFEDESKKYKDLFELIKNTIWSDKIETVKSTDRLWDNLWALASKEWSMTPQMEKMMKAMGQQVPVQKRTLELNPNHKITKLMLEEFNKDLKSEKLNNLIQYVYEQAMLLEWAEIQDYKAFVNRINGFIS